MNIVVVGGLGFIGHQVSAQLVKHGHHVYIIDNMGMLSSMSETTWFYEQRKRAVYDHGNSVTLRTQSFSYTGIKYLIAEIKPDVIIFMPGPANQRQAAQSPQLAIQQMIAELHDFLHEVRDHTKRVVYVSSSMVYGDFTEPVAEHDILNPSGIYAIAKFTGELLVKDITKHYGIEHVIVRPSAVYGPLDTVDRVVSQFLLKALRDETLIVKGANEKLDFTYVDDAATGIVLAATAPMAANNTYNITRGVAVSLYEAATAITQMVGTGKVKVVSRDTSMPSRNALNIEQARLDLGFDPKTNFEQGIRRYYDWLITTPYYLGDWKTND